MSYILDALRRSEEERNRGHVPALKTVYYDREERDLDFLQSTTGRILVLALLLALAALLYSNRAPLMGVVDRMFGDEQQAVAEMAQPAAVAVSPPPQQPVVAPAQPTTQPVADQVMRAESQPVQPIPAQATPPVQTQAVAPAQPAPTQVSVANTQPAPATPQARTDSSQPPATGDVKTKHDLPPDVMRSVPKLALSVVSYTADPKKRFVMVDSEMYYEGEEITENLIIEAITADGPIVSWRGHEFLMQP